MRLARRPIMTKKPEVLSTQKAAQTSIFQIEKVALKFSNGEERLYERLGPFNAPVKAVMIVPITAAGNFIMVEEYAVGLESYQISFPKGLVEKGETLFEGAERELKEEANFGAKSMHFLTEFALSPHYMCHKMQVVIAQDLYESTLPGDEPESLIVHEISEHELIKLIKNQTLNDVRSIAAMYMAKDFLVANA